MWLMFVAEYFPNFEETGSGVVWHTGKVLACGAVGPRFNSWHGKGICRAYLFCSVSGWHTTPVARWVGLVLEPFPFTNAASQWL